MSEISRLNLAHEMSDNNEDIDMIMVNLYSEDNVIMLPSARRKTLDIDIRGESILAEVISEKIQNKGLPLALRKRLMYERAIAQKKIE